MSSIEPERKRKKLVKSVATYTHSYKNESLITSLVANSNNSIVVTGLADGRIKFWKRDKEDSSSLQCIKQFMAHPGISISQLLINQDNSKLATLAKGDNRIKLFDLTTLDMIQDIKIGFIPNTVSSSCNSWFFSDGTDFLLIGDENNMCQISPEEQSEDKENIVKIYPQKRVIKCIAYNYKYECFISSDDRGLIEYWTPNLSSLPKGVEFTIKSQTDLFKLIKSKTIPNNIILSTSNEYFLVQSEQTIHKFDFKSGKIADTIQEDHITSAYLEGDILMYTTKDTIISYDLQQQQILAKYGTEDKETYNLIALFNETPTTPISSEMITSKNSLVNSKLNTQPMVIATSSDKLFVFGSQGSDYKESTIKNSKVTLHTTLGDIKIELFDKLTPKTVENFITLCKKKYYNNVIFHRVIKSFMIQTGDPKGDGTGGESCWGGHFPDEFNNQLNHKQPFMVSMANAGPNTNGSQFFITTDEASFLDNKHTIFGKVIQGIDIVKQIENVETDENDKPIEQIAIISTTLTK